MARRHLMTITSTDREPWNAHLVCGMRSLLFLLSDLILRLLTASLLVLDNCDRLELPGRKWLGNIYSRHSQAPRASKLLFRYAYCFPCHANPSVSCMLSIHWLKDQRPKIYFVLLPPRGLIKFESLSAIERTCKHRYSLQ